MHALYVLVSCFNLWLPARIAGLPISFSEMLAMRRRMIDVRSLVRILLAAREAGFRLSSTDIEQAQCAGADLNALAFAVSEVNRLGLDVGFNDVVAALCSLSEDFPAKWQELTARRLDGAGPSTAPNSSGSEVTRQPHFYVQKARPEGMVFVFVGIVGLCATWIFATELFPLVVLTAIFGGFVCVGAPAAFKGGSYRCWFADGRVHWACPGRMYGSSDSCGCAEIVEFKMIAHKFNDIIQFKIVLKDGSTKTIQRDCFGDREKFIWP